MKKVRDMVKNDWYLLGAALVLFYVPLAYFFIFHGWRVGVGLLCMFWGNNMAESMGLSRVKEIPQ